MCECVYRRSVTLNCVCLLMQQLNVSHAEDPILHAWHGAAHCAHDPQFPCITKAQYDELGAEACKERFAGW